MERMNIVIAVAVPDGQLKWRLSGELLFDEKQCELLVVGSLEALRARVRSNSPCVIVVHEALFGGESFAVNVRKLAENAAVIFVGHSEREEELAQLVGEGAVEFVAVAGNYIPLVVALVKRRVRWAELLATRVHSPQAERETEFRESLRHEINNPLTGILGNAELLLASHERFSSSSVQRLETIVDLAVRLRETVRLLTGSAESPEAPLHVS